MIRELFKKKVIYLKASSKVFRSTTNWIKFKSLFVILCDGGGSNSSRYYIFKQDLQALVNELGIEIRIAHYPPYTSKYNPIEHRLFPHISRVCHGVIFESVQTVKDLMATATTRTGLKVFTTILDKTYQTGRKVALDFKSNMKIVFDEFLPQWNYTAQPELQVI
ncbi:ISAzo13-like element transposase-related protein [Anabaena sp. UHCC 0399]|uniref:ISAzo13-like element transposase-related protein n=1 Tax=Anabaena sp. UHCC 0399 TaxID=3110238 RepID=UPI002B2086BF|nr:hypothetical protein [Anabaena sp. UHCC 0399]MEA5565754.1 hypothetical protein [Anabaena sp. UHCC 0399]